MPTAVLASVATGFPEKLRKAAFPILRTPELYDYDLERTIHEIDGNEINWHKTGFNLDPLADLYTEERRKAALRPWRRENLESLIVRLQFTDMREEVFVILDELRSSVPSDDKRWLFRFHRIDARGWEPEADKVNNRIIFMPKSIEPDLQEIQQKTQEDQALNNRFCALGLWSVHTFKNEPLEQEYYANWEDALEEAKSLLDILNSGSASDFARMQFGGIVKATSIFLRDHSSELDEEDANWCVELVIQAVLSDANTKDTIAAADKTDHRGAAAAASVLPVILDYTENDEERLYVKKVIATTLTHANDNVRKETANGIREHLWQRDADFAQKCIDGTIEYARLFLDEINRKRQTNRVWNIEGEENVESDESAAWLGSFRDQFASGQITADPVDISFISYSSWHILCPCLMVPNGSTEPSHISLLSKVLSLLIEAEESKNRYRYSESEKVEIHYELPIDFAKRFADYLLSMSESDGKIFIEQLQIACESAPSLVYWLLLCIAVSTEKMGNKELYWRFWKQFSDRVQEIAIAISQELNKQNSRYNEKTKLIRGMLHADNPWQKVDYENQDIVHGKDLILEFVKNAGTNPDVFESMASLMYHFPGIFLNQGLNLLSKHQEAVGGTQLLSGVNTAFYLERCIQRFLLWDSTGRISKEMHQSCSVLLNAIIDTASSGAYYLREHLIRSRKVFD